MPRFDRDEYAEMDDYEPQRPYPMTPEWEVDQRSLGIWDLLTLILVVVIGIVVYALAVPESDVRSLLDCVKEGGRASFCFEVFVERVLR